jgi:uncharacterized protein YbjT (DUF2867 family)
MRIVVFGANGRTGRLLTQQALADGHDVVAVTRRPKEFPLSHPRLSVAGADVRKPSTLPRVLDGADAVVSILGVPMGLPRIDIYSTGVTNIIDAMRQAEVKRLVAVSSTAVTHYPGRTRAPFALRIIEPVLKATLGRTTYADQRRMETVIGDSGLDWTVVRPSGLFDKRDVTEYIAGQVDPVGAFTSRTDLAHHLMVLAGQRGPRAAVTISTVEGTPSMWETVRREAFANNS